MIHYHGTPVSGTKQDAARFLVGRHALVSFVHQQNLPEVLEYCQSFVLDNGAFSHWKAGKGEINFADFCSWVSQFARHPNFDWCLIPDKIDGTEQENRDLVNRWLDSGIEAKGVPVWHMHESLEYLGDLIHEFDVVAFGSSGTWSMPNTQGWWGRMSEAMRVACDESGRPRAKLHGLRMLNPDVFTRLPLSSADSTNATMNAGNVSGFGMYPAPTAGVRAGVIADRIEQHNSAPVWVGAEQIDLFMEGAA